MSSVRSLPLACLLALAVFASPAAAGDGLVIDGLTSTEGSLGSRIGILCEGVQEKPKPKVFLVSDGQKVKGTKLKVMSLGLAPGGGGTQQLLVVEVKKAVRGTYQVLVQGPKGSTPAVSSQTFEVVVPIADGLSANTANVGDTVVLSARNVGNRKPKVWIGNKKAKVQELIDAGTEGVVTQQFLVRIPTSIPDGTWPVTLENKIGMDMLHGAITTSGSKKTNLGKPGITGLVDGQPFRCSAKTMSSDFDTPEVIIIQGLGGLPGSIGAQLVCFPLEAALDGPFPQVFTALPADLIFVNLLPGGDVTWRASDFGNFELHLDNQHFGRVVGSYKGTLIRIIGTAPPEFLEVEGRFVGELPEGI